MTPKSVCGPVERGFVERIPCLDTEQLAASRGGLCQSYLPRLDGLLNSKMASCQNWLNATTWSERPKFFVGSLEPVSISGAHTAYTLERGEVYLGVSNEDRRRWFASPSFGFPSHSFSP